MCGILARFGKRSAKPFNIQQQLDLLRHRGPDGRGAIGWNDGEPYCWLSDGDLATKRNIVGHVRLSIIDLSDAGAQPFVSRNRQYVLSYNGELYNYLELRKELASNGVEFATECDTEVLLEAWMYWGSACLEKLEGMFAFIIFDRGANKVFMCRDAFGIKPLYILKSEDEYVISSEIGPLIARTGGINYNDRQVSHILRWGCDDGFEETFAQGINRLPPGRCRSLNLDNFHTYDESKFFDIESISEEDWSFEEAKTVLRDTFVSSVDHHMRSDAALGFALSGGIDSSSIVCCAHELGRSGIRTFTYIPGDASISEFKWAKLVIDRVNADATLISPTAEDVQQKLSIVAGGQGEPFASLSIFAQNEVYRKVAESRVKVILSGQGADELLAGYLNFFLTMTFSEIRKGHLGTAATLVKAMRRRFGMGPGATLTWLARSTLPRAIKELVAKSYLQKKAPWLNVDYMTASGIGSFVDINLQSTDHLRLKPALKSAIRDTLVALLRYDDRNSMAHSVESRVPFLTPKLAKLCLSFPDEFLISKEGKSKHVFCEAMRGIVPDEILDRTDKINFAPDNIAWKTAFSELLSENESYPKLQNFLDPRKLQHALRRTSAGGDDNIELLWRATNLLMLDEQNRHTVSR